MYGQGDDDDEDDDEDDAFLSDGDSLNTETSIEDVGV
uniref:Uncharacterized protein n=1 Tax=Peronospora matthiolae TaxID=2874970 RepID=A0AAV1UV89_9STRA